MNWIRCDVKARTTCHKLTASVSDGHVQGSDASTAAPVVILLAVLSRK